MIGNIGYLYYKEYFKDEYIHECKIQSKSMNEKTIQLIKSIKNIGQ
ncbi:hypothetical protein JTT08_09455 [Clostridium botulinum]|nr:hypothetical protein [Clostridium botulinum]